MESYRYQELAYLVVPVSLGIEFFFSAREERKDKKTAPIGSYLLDFFGYIFSAFIPAIFFFTIWAIEYKVFPSQAIVLAKLDRYGVMFFFFGAWWQVLLITTLRVRRFGIKGASKWKIWIPYLILGTFISFDVLWVSPWNLRWVSTFLFFMLFAILIKIPVKTVEKIFWVLIGFIFLMENILFIYLEAVL